MLSVSSSNANATRVGMSPDVRQGLAGLPSRACASGMFAGQYLHVWSPRMAACVMVRIRTRTESNRSIAIAPAQLDTKLPAYRMTASAVLIEALTVSFGTDVAMKASAARRKVVAQRLFTELHRAHLGWARLPSTKEDDASGCSDTNNPMHVRCCHLKASTPQGRM